MTGEDAIRGIILLYEKHGWTLRRVLLSDELSKRLDSVAPTLFNGIKPARSDIDAAWFTRASHAGKITWELRLLTDPPFALLAVVDADIEDSNLDAILNATERQMSITRT